MRRGSGGRMNEWMNDFLVCRARFSLSRYQNAPCSKSFRSLETHRKHLTSLQLRLPSPERQEVITSCPPCWLSHVKPFTVIWLHFSGAFLGEDFFLFGKSDRSGAGNASRRKEQQRNTCIIQNQRDICAGNRTSCLPLFSFQCWATLPMSSNS